MKTVYHTLSYFVLAIFLSCNNSANQQSTRSADTATICINPKSTARLNHMNGVPIMGDTIDISIGRYANYKRDTSSWPPKPWPKGMVWIPGGEFDMGGVGDEARKDEFPVHRVKVNGFWMDETEVTVEEFEQFVKATKYVTIAERKPDWEQLKQTLPPGTPRPDESKLVPGSMVFLPTAGPVTLDDYTQWWGFIPGASWKKPLGPEYALDVLEDKRYATHPVVQVSWLDAVAYCTWADKQLPTEAEWEYAARGGLKGMAYCWGNERPHDKNIKANLWQGKFPYHNDRKDGFVLTAPVKSFEPNGYGLFDMTGNVWEWCSDWYRPDTYQQYALAKLTVNPQGPKESYVPDEPYCAKRIVRGGSFLCNQDFCASYRPSARMSTDPYSGMSHTGFRCVMSQEQWLKHLSNKTN